MRAGRCLERSRKPYDVYHNTFALSLTCTRIPSRSEFHVISMEIFQLKFESTSCMKHQTFEIRQQANLSLAPTVFLSTPLTRQMTSYSRSQLQSRSSNIFTTMPRPKRKRPPPTAKVSRPAARSFPFTKLPFELQREIFQYLLVASPDQIIRPEEPHSEFNDKCFIHKSYWERRNGITVAARLSEARPCYHTTLNTQLLKVSRGVSLLAVQVLYGCNKFHFSAASLFNRFTNTINAMGVRSIRYLAIEYPTFRSL